MKDRSLTDRIYLFLKGIAMGTVNKVPGVSGGIVALIGGFYEEMIYTFQKFNGKAFALFFKGRWKSFYNYVNLSFLFWLLLGIVFSYFSTALLLDYLIGVSEINVWASFFGMILASLFYIYPQVSQWKSFTLYAMLGGLLLGVLVSFSDPIPENDHLGYIFICGVISVCGMTLPGLSGSYLLLLMGNYSLLLVDSVNDLNNIFFQLIQGNEKVLESLVHQQTLLIITAFVLGSLTGLVLFSNVLAYLLKHYKNQTLSGIIGFIVGALPSVWPWKNTIYQKNEDGLMIRAASGNPKIANYEIYWPQWNEVATWTTLFFIFVGAAIVVILEWYGKTQTKYN